MPKSNNNHRSVTISGDYLGGYAIESGVISGLCLNSYIQWLLLITVT